MIESKPDWASALDRTIEYLYREGPNVEIGAFRRWALNQVRPLVPFDAALWGVGSFEDQRFHSTTSINLAEDFPAVVERTRDINPAFVILHDHPGVPISINDLLGVQFRDSEIYRALYQPFGLEHILATAIFDRVSGLFALITFYRQDREAPFTKYERKQAERLVAHLAGAGSNAYFRGLSGLNQVEHADSRLAVCDAYGVLHEAQPGFVDLLRHHYTGWSGPRLPFDLDSCTGTEPLSCQGLRGHRRAVGDLLLVELWEANVFDELTAREREVVRGVANGLSQKEVAREIGISPGTVSTHIKRVYGKLGIHSRSALSQLIRKPA